MTDHVTGPLPESYWVRPGRLLAGPYPGSYRAEHTRPRLEALRDAGVTVCVDLTETGEMPPYASLLPEGMTHRRLPIPDMDVPIRAHMIAVLDTLDEVIAQGGTAYIHCFAGRGRTGTVVGCYLARHGVAGQAALDAIVRLRGGRRNSPETFAQTQLVALWCEETTHDDQP
jgi:protein-tyrosine phosphatase